MMDDDQIRERLRQALSDGGHSARALSEGAGLGQTAIRDILGARSKSPKASTLAALEDALGKPRGFLTGAGERQDDRSPAAEADAEHRSRVEELMRARGLSSVELSRSAKLSLAAVERMRKGYQGVPVGNRAALARVLNVSLHTLDEDVGSPIPTLAYSADSDVQPAPDVQPPQRAHLQSGLVAPVMGTAEGGEVGFFEINLTDGPVEYVDIPAGLTGVAQGDLFAIRVQGESMEPVWEAGDIVFIVKSRPKKAGAYVVVQLKSTRGHQPRALLKKYVSEDTSGEIILEQFNPRKTIHIKRDEVIKMWRALHWREFQT